MAFDDGQPSAAFLRRARPSDLRCADRLGHAIEDHHTLAAASGRKRFGRCAEAAGGVLPGVHHPDIARDFRREARARERHRNRSRGQSDVLAPERPIREADIAVSYGLKTAIPASSSGYKRSPMAAFHGRSHVFTLGASRFMSITQRASIFHSACFDLRELENRAPD